MQRERGRERENSAQIENYMKPKLVEENIGNAQQDIGALEEFLYRTPFAQKLRPKIDKWHLKYHCSVVNYQSSEDQLYRVGESLCQL